MISYILQDICDNLVFIGLLEHKEKFQLEGFIQKKYAYLNPRFLWLDKTTRGQAETVLLAKDLISRNDELLVFNIDTMFDSQTLKTLILANKYDGILGAFESDEDRFSYAKISDDGIVVKTAEKEVISKYALNGLYHFKLAKDFFDVAKHQIDNNMLYKGEYYIAPMYNELINSGKKFTVDLCQKHWILGTPDELNDFKENYV